jgi:hypothetical protein
MADGLLRDANEVIRNRFMMGDALEKIEAVLGELSPRSRPLEDQVLAVFDCLVNPAGVAQVRVSH